MSNLSFAKIVQDFFLNRLINQKNVSPQTISSYRDTIRLLLHYLYCQNKKAPSCLTIADIDASVILKFLNYLEKERNNSITSRNARLSAIRSLFRYASFIQPESMEIIQKVLAIPMKRSNRLQVLHLTKEEIESIINAPDSSSWSGMRDRTMFMTFYNIGARVSEIIALRISHVSIGKNSYARIQGKGRKERIIPLWKSTAHMIKTWIKYLGSNHDNYLFPNNQGNPLTRQGVKYRLRLAKNIAERNCPSLKNKKVCPHILRHTTAMHLLQSGIDISLIALWLGHESPLTTHIYLQADIVMKESILKKLDPPASKYIRYRANDSLLQFLEKL
ncbi:MAG: integrase [Candidatus Fischerbacteria bacterium RBG_13_37_8]|uniref:Integrase n=1 Tax=Candidatus Fischerbacteria bacterium RBG_13_37_8 TaxID=1817863 RepID=A0A1F5VMB0_9BACT|nr:MAG: integrase [Candidatus Fischerbacteria bacterium RBG_13_37_8]